MKDLISTIGADRITRSATITAIVILFITLLYLIVFYNSLPPYLPLFNQLGWGDPRLAEKPWIFLLPTMTLFIIIGNAVLASVLYASMPLIARIISITALLISSLTLIFIFRVTQLLL
jgi:hypothetical protein